MPENSRNTAAERDIVLTIDGIPVYTAVVGDGGAQGMKCISLVSDPAVLTGWIAMSREKWVDELARTGRGNVFSVTSEERRLVRGVIMRADFPIYRRGVDGSGSSEYYIVFRPDTIRRMAEKYLSEGRSGRVNLEHTPGTGVADVDLVQWFIKDSAAGVDPEGFADVADGSLFAEYHVRNDDVWAQIKAGTYKGFSLEGFFDLVPVLRLTHNNNSSGMRKNKLSRIKAELARRLVHLTSVTTTNGDVLAWDGEADVPEKGDSVYIVDEEGNRTAATDGEYRLEDGTSIVVSGGTVAEILEPGDNGGDAAEPTEAPDEPVSTQQEEDGNNDGEKKEDEGDAAASPTTTELYALFVALCELLGIDPNSLTVGGSSDSTGQQSEGFARSADLHSLELRVEQLEKAPAAMNAHREYNSTTAEPESSVRGNKQLERAIRLAGAAKEM